jgi:hypothetical protein
MTDYYSQCEDALKALFMTATSTFTKSWQVSDNDTAINNGAECFVTFSPGQFQEVPNGKDGAVNVMIGWEVLFELKVRFSTIAKSKAQFKAVRSELFNLIKDHKRLDYPKPTTGIGVLGTTLIATKQVQYWYDRQGQPSPTWIFQPFKATVLQSVPIGK